MAGARQASGESYKASPFPPLIFAALGTLLILAYGYTRPNFQFLEFIVSFIAVLFFAIGYTQNVVRSIASAEEGSSRTHPFRGWASWTT